MLFAVAALAFPAVAAAEPPPPGAYQQDDVGGFRNILPPGSNGHVTPDELVDFFTSGAFPPHSHDQHGLYDDLVYASPELERSRLGDFFKEASFGVPVPQRERTYTPDCAIVSAPSPDSGACDDVTIVRDEDFGVPHVYGQDRAGLMFGIGYITAEDRLFLADFLRHAGRAELSSFAGGSQVGQDREVWREAPYTEAELQEMFDRVGGVGPDVRQAQEDTLNYVDGINQFIAEARDEPATKMPAEYGALGRPGGPDPWKVTDVTATGILVSGIFGKGGGGEVGSAIALREAQRRFGRGDGRQVWRDFRSAEDPETPTTVRGKRFPYGASPPAKRVRGRALPDSAKGVHPVPVVVGSSGSGGAPRTEREGFLDRLHSQFKASNALLVSKRQSKGAHPTAVFGPQVGYFAPQILMEQDVHAPGGPKGPPIDARGVAFAGTNLYVQLGRGPDYAWSATSAGQDITDTFALELCEPDGSKPDLRSRHYRFGGTCLPFEVLKKTNSWTPNAADATPAGSETLRSYRTKLGIVTHRAMIDGEPHAYTSLRSTYFHEIDSAVGFADFNNPNRVRTPRSFQKAANRIDYTFNWFYVDDEHIGYFNSGDNPVRAPGTDPNLPIRGKPQFWWRDFDPETLTSKQAGFAKHPQAIDQRFLTSWNNNQAKGYRAADGDWSNQSVHRVQPLDDRIRDEIQGSGKMAIQELVDAMEDAATVDLRGDAVLPWLLRAVRRGAPIRSAKLRRAVGQLERWMNAGAHRLDRNRDGTYGYADAIRIMDAWWPRLVRSQFHVLGEGLQGAIEDVRGIHNAPGPSGSAFGGGWYGYVQKDLRSLLGRDVRGPYSRVYCGRGDIDRCRGALRRSLQRAMSEGFDEVYGEDDCDGGDAQWCHDSIRYTAAGALNHGPLHWVNRPTFQQVVRVLGHR